LNFDFHPRAVVDWLRAADFRVERRLSVSHFRLPLFKRLLPLSVLVGLDSLAQWTGNLWQLTPSVFVRARATGADEPAPPGALWRCPACAGFDLQESSHGLACASCQRAWPRRNGIYDFRDAPV